MNPQDILPTEISSTTAPEDRSGPQTTEFWLSLVTVLGTLVVAFRPTLASKVGVDQVRQWATLAAGLTSIGYALSRAWVKHGSASAKAAAAVAAIHAPAIPVALEVPTEVDEPADASIAPRAGRPVQARPRRR